jgi:pyruvate/2-oxoglutarate dehydrogenase complex dihydrolipoamide acyltransferase (E2) component
MNSFKEIPWLKHRDDVVDFLDLAHDRNFVTANSEADITKISKLFKERKQRGIKSNSITAYLLWCYGQAIRQHPVIHAIKFRNNLILFDDVDIALVIEKEHEGQKVTYPYIFRSVQDKTFEDLNAELNRARNFDFAEIKKSKKSLIIKSLPKMLRMYILKRLLKDPVKAKMVLGTAALTCLGMVAANRRFWPVPYGPYPLVVATGGHYDDGEKKFLCLSFSVDHNIIDGAPVARFGKTLIGLIESGSGII